MADSLYGFKSVNEIGDYQHTEQMENNIVTWANWGMLGIGAFNTVTTSDDTSILKPLADPRYATGTIWQGQRSDWIWESGIPYGIQPTQISGVYITGVFYPSATTGIYAHKINYQDGYVVFNSPIPTGTQVKLNHSYKYTQVRRSNEPWFQSLCYDTFNTEDNQFADLPLSSGAGTWGTLAEHRVQLPCLIVEPLTDVKLVPLEIGNKARIHRQTFFLHVLAEQDWEQKRIHDILINQYNQTIKTLDFNTAPMPLNYDKSLASGAKTYPDLASGYPWRPLRIVDITSNQQDTLGKKLHWSVVKYVLETDIA